VSELTDAMQMVDAKLAKCDEEAKQTQRELATTISNLKTEKRALEENVEESQRVVKGNEDRIAGLEAANLKLERQAAELSEEALRKEESEADLRRELEAAADREADFVRECEESRQLLQTSLLELAIGAKTALKRQVSESKNPPETPEKLEMPGGKRPKTVPINCAESKRMLF